jgi:hypothetical protein
MNDDDFLSKVEPVERTLSIFDNHSKDLLQELEVGVPLEMLRLIVAARDGDYKLYLPYVLDELQIRRLAELMGNHLQPDFDSNYYVLEASGIYNC